MDDEEKENCPCREELRSTLYDFHDELMAKLTLTALQESTGEVN